MAASPSLRVALTGATGFIGHHLVQQLSPQHALRLLRRQPSPPSAAGPHAIVGDLSQANALQALVKDQDVVVHVAGATNAANADAFMRHNAVGTLRLIEALEQEAAESQRRPRLIVISSLAARHPNLSPYAASKAAAEDLVRSSRLDWVIVRPPAVYGPGDRALAPLWASLSHGWLLRLGPAHARFAMLHVSDLVSALAHMLSRTELCGQTIELDDGQPDGHSWHDIARAAEQLRQGPVRTVPIPRTALHWTAKLRLAGPMLTPGKVAELTHPNWCIDERHRYQASDWSPQLDLLKGLRTLMGW